jgi:hypothetical protein
VLVFTFTYLINFLLTKYVEKKQYTIVEARKTAVSIDRHVVHTTMNTLLLSISMNQSSSVQIKPESDRPIEHPFSVRE